MLFEVSFHRWSIALFSGLTLLLVPITSFGQGDQKQDSKEKNDSSQKFSVADGYLNFSAPGDWKKTKPKFDFFHAEFQIPKSEGDEQNGRITFSQVGGSVDQNLERWISQFTDAAATKDAVKRTTKTVDGKQVQLIQIQGTFLDSAGGPVGPKTEREHYVLYGAAIEGENGNNIYVKAYGPKKTMAANHENLKSLIEKMKVSED